MNNNDEVYFSDELYEYYKGWLNTALSSYRTSSGPARDTWLKLSHRASCLCDLWLKLGKEFERKSHE